MSKTTRTEKKPIEQYDHKGKERCNNPPVGLVTPETDRGGAKKTCAYDPHLTQIPKNFFIIAPGLTVKSRLEVLQPSAFGNYYHEFNIIRGLKITYESYTRPDT